MLKYIAFAVQGLALIGGAAVGVWIKSSAASPDAAAEDAVGHDAHDDGAHEAATRETAPKKDKKDAHGASDGKKGGHESSKGGGAEGYVKFSRQFVVPVLGDNQVRALVVLDLTVETPPGAAEGLYAREPKLRDALLAALLDLSNKGAFSARLLEQANLGEVRAALVAAARGVIGDDAKDVLILGVTRQDV